MGVALSTLGVRVSYAFSATAGSTERPTADYVILGDIKEVPDFNPAPDSIEVTPLINAEYKTYVQGLKDLGSNLVFTANFTKELLNEYNKESTGVTAEYESGKKMWLQIDHPQLDESLFVNVAPSKIGLNSMSVNSALEVSLHFTPLGEPIWAEKATYKQNSSSSDTII